MADTVNVFDHAENSGPDKIDHAEDSGPDKIHHAAALARPPQDLR
jgi:hypothetical protein